MNKDRGEGRLLPLAHGAAVDSGEPSLPGKARQVPPHGHLRHRETLGQVHDCDTLSAANGVQDQPSSLRWKHLCALVPKRSYVVRQCAEM